MAKILLELVNPPEGMGASQLFYNEVHFMNEWLTPNASKFGEYSFSGKALASFPSVKEKFTFEGGTGTISEVANDHVN